MAYFETKERQYAKVIIDITSNRFYVVQAGKIKGWYLAAHLAYAKMEQINSKL